eukprot:CAMPEP_0114580822 /NCGR_PEP_ID=MMETSP0125-20121206/5018_1 /TAXON_ID=485358 ORGANISM="Aristerostoma sp., Strain ATCC 50986" /NCGR_SAMPLE_ID=MMETSP0125 /ASSEMBLY_ACC=CAM_ASM_000245 /LENGTH=40 /DNA_ID= /DNA_START= /DNA_END= /DNA_ORIENTATION=
MLLPAAEDDMEAKKLKNLFRELSIHFIKYYSVKWIYDGKI